jgi:hypothetical protein
MSLPPGALFWVPKVYCCGRVIAWPELLLLLLLRRRRHDSNDDEDDDSDC